MIVPRFGRPEPQSRGDEGLAPSGGSWEGPFLAQPGPGSWGPCGRVGPVSASVVTPPPWPHPLHSAAFPLPPPHENPALGLASGQPAHQGALMQSRLRRVSVEGDIPGPRFVTCVLGTAHPAHPATPPASPRPTRRLQWPRWVRRGLRRRGAGPDRALLGGRGPLSQERPQAGRAAACAGSGLTWGSPGNHDGSPPPPRPLPEPGGVLALHPRAVPDSVPCGARRSDWGRSTQARRPGSDASGGFALRASPALLPTWTRAARLPLGTVPAGVAHSAQGTRVLCEGCNYFVPEGSEGL